MDNKFIVLMFLLFIFGCVKNPPIEKPIPCYPEASKEFLRWNKSKGKELKGLTRRRQEEQKLFLQGCTS